MYLPNIILFVSILCPLVVNAAQLPEKVCRGTNQRHTSANMYTLLKRRYTNCTVIDGNLEIRYIENQPDDMSFLSTIREVTGYVLVLVSNFPTLPLTNLEIIRGETLYRGKYSLSIYYNRYPGYERPGLRIVKMPNLREIVRGEVQVNGNRHLCFVNSIDWTQITTGRVDVVNPEEDSCQICDPNVCSNCWDLGRENCQAMDVKSECHASCTNGCFGRGRMDCCDQKCAAGCFGPRNSQCRYCRGLEDDGVCVSSCPPHKYRHGRKCVRHCPDYLPNYGKMCVDKVCPVGYDQINDECLPCGRRCKKRCLGLNVSRESLDPSTIGRFNGCEIVVGSIMLTKRSFEAGLTRDQLRRSLSSVKEITGYLYVSSLKWRAAGVEFPIDDLSFFENLTAIHGRKLMESGYSFVVHHTPFVSLGLPALRKIGNGRVLIRNNPNLRIDPADLRPLIGKSVELVVESNYVPPTTPPQQD